MKKNIFFWVFFTVLSNPIISNVIFVNQSNISGQNTGDSWEDAYINIHSALSNWQEGDSIWIASGIYKPTDTDNRNIYFEIPEGAKIFGGFSGEEFSLSQRDLQNNQTILSGNIANISNHLDNSYTIASIIITGQNITIIDGIHFEAGAAIPNEIAGENCDNLLRCRGGGLFVESQSTLDLTTLEIRNCQFMSNGASVGGGMYVNAENGLLNLTVDNCSFIGNFDVETISSTSEEINGGGICILQKDDTLIMQHTIFKDCIFQDNSSYYSGGGLYYKQENNDLLHPKLTIIGSSFINNFADGNYGGRGGAIYLSGAASGNDDILIENSDFTLNSAGHGFEIGQGGALYSASGGNGIKVKSCQFNSNVAHEGGGIFSFGNVFCVDNHFNQNLALTGGAIVNYGYLSIYNCVLSNNHAVEAGGAIYNLTFGANYSNSTFYNNNSDNGGGALSFGGTNSTLTNCIFWENKSINTNQNIIEGGGDTLTLKGCIFDTPDCESVTGFIFNDIINCEDNTFFNEYPEFRDTANLDFSLISCSIGVNAGSDIPDVFSDINTDIAGNLRVLDGIPDIGAYEVKEIEAFATILNATGVNNEDGSIEIDSIIGGIPPYEISWNNNTEGELNDNLPHGNYEMTVIDSLGCTYLTSYEVSFTSGGNNFQRKGYSLSPNPTKEFCTFSWLGVYPNKWNIKIFNTNGKLLFSQFNLTSEFVSIDILDYPSGVYIISVEENGNILNEKFIKM